MTQAKDALVATAIEALEEGKRVALVIRGRERSIEVRKIEMFLDRPGTITCVPRGEWEWTIDIQSLDAVVVREDE